MYIHLLLVGLVVVNKHEEVVYDLLEEKEVTLIAVVNLFAEVVHYQIVNVKVSHYSLSFLQP